MKCPECQTECTDTQQFCGGCGTKLEKICPECGAKNSPKHKFCGECGLNLELPSERVPKELSFDEKLDKLQRYLPKGLTKKILSLRDRIEGERKEVTVMFCDMAGYTTLVERLGSEEAYSIMDEVYEILIHKVHDYEGTVNEMTGDGIMALFGAPIALENAPERAIRSALAIQREMTRFNNRLKDKGSDTPTLKMRIGINSGPVVVGTLGNNLRVEFKAVGDTVNLASRVEALTEPGATDVTEFTFRLTEGLFRFEALGEKRIKGMEKPVQLYRVIAPSTRRTRFDVSAESGLTPFVGRGKELELLLEGLERVRAGHGQAFSVVSEAGQGKTRLLYEFRKAITNEDVTFLEGKCVSYGKGLSYHPIADILKSNFGIREEDGPSIVKDKVKSGLATLGADEPFIIPYILELLSVRESGIDKIMMSPEGKKDGITEALKYIVLKGAQIRPLLLAIEDLHWVDVSSEDVLKALLQTIAGARVFLLFTYRPEFVPTWGAKSYQSQITLNRLSNRETIQIAKHLLTSEQLSADLERVLLGKAEGVPFFLEEFVKSLRHLKLVEKDDATCRLTKEAQNIGIPATIHDVIMARVDGLPETAKDVLQLGSMIEREFSHELIGRVAGFKEKELLSHLEALKDSELIFSRGITPRITYVFKHALTRDVIKNSILRNRKKKLHDRIGKALEEIHQESLEDQYGVLANHFMEAENYAKAAEYLKAATKKAQRTGALKDAIGYGVKLVSCLERLPRTDSVVKGMIDARVTLGLCYLQINNFVQSREAVEPVIDLAKKYDLRRRIAQIHTVIGVHTYAVEEDTARASEELRDAISAAESTGDLISLVMANHWMGHVLADNCEFERSLFHLNKGLEINIMANVPWGISAHKSCIGRTVYLYQGKVDVGFPICLEGFKTAEENGDIYSRAEAHISMGCAWLFKRQLEDAQKHFLLGCDLCERLQFTGLLSLGEWGVGETYFLMEKYDEAQHHYGTSVEIAEANSFMPSYARATELARARARAANGQPIEDLDVLLGYVAKNKMKLVDGRIRRHLAEILLHSDDADLHAAEDWINGAVGADRQNAVLFDLARDLAVLGEICRRRHQHSKAKEAVGEAISIFKDCGADGWVKKYEEELASLT